MLSASSSFELSKRGSWGRVGVQSMDTIEECGDGSDRHLLSGSRILVGVPDNSRGCSELLSWAIGAVAKANDSVVAVHVLGKLL